MGCHIEKQRNSTCTLERTNSNIIEVQIDEQKTFTGNVLSKKFFAESSLEPMENRRPRQFLGIGMKIESFKKFGKRLQQRFDQLGPFELTKALLVQKKKNFQLMDNNSIYLGQMKNDCPHGIGILHDDKIQYLIEGYWENGSLTGPARVIYYNGDYYEGQMKNYRANGNGLYVNYQKSMEGVWVNDKLQGQGIEIQRFPEQKYIGNFVNTVPDGFGTYIYPDGRKYIGQVKEGKQHGHGKMIWADESTYEGEFEKDLIKGKGTYKEGNTYIINDFVSVRYKLEGLYLLFYNEDTVNSEVTDIKVIQKRISRIKL